MTYPGGKHGLIRMPQTGRHYYEMVTEFFEKNSRRTLKPSNEDRRSRGSWGARIRGSASKLDPRIGARMTGAGYLPALAAAAPPSAHRLRADHRLEFIEPHPSQVLSFQRSRRARVLRDEPEIELDRAIGEFVLIADQRLGLYTSIPISSRSSRVSVSSRSSFASRLPPGNSQPPAMCLPGGRSASSRRPSESKSAPATTCASGGGRCRGRLIGHDGDCCRERGCAARNREGANGRAPLRARLILYPSAPRAPWQCLYFLPEPHGHGSLRPTFFVSRTNWVTCCDSAVSNGSEFERRRAELLRLCMLELHRLLEATLPLGFLGVDLFLSAQLHARQERYRVVLDAIEHRREQLERFALVLLLRVLLRIAAQVNALPQIVHRGQMLAPVRIELLQHHGLFEMSHDRRAVLLHLCFVRLSDLGEHSLAHIFFVEILVLSPSSLDVDGDREISADRLDEPVNIPHFLDALRRDETIDQAIHDFVANARDGIADILCRHDSGALLIDHLALIVRDVVVLEQVLTSIEVVRFDFALRALDCFLSIRLSMTSPSFMPAVCSRAWCARIAEDAHEVVFERKIEAARAGVALTTRAAAQLIVDAARLVAFGADDVQTACPSTAS